MTVERERESRAWGPLQIEKYALDSGGCPFDDWLKALSPQDQALEDTRLMRVGVENLGETKALGDGVLELKVKFGAGFRIYYGRSGKRVILLWGQTKTNGSMLITELKTCHVLV